MARPDTAQFQMKQYDDRPQAFENELIAQLPGLLISQFDVPQPPCNGHHGATGLRFDFMDDWYSIIAYLDDGKNPTGYYHISMQSPLHNDDGIWKGTDLVLAADIAPGWEYMVRNEEEFIQAVEDGWMRVYAAANARKALRDMCNLVEQGRLPQEVMDALGAENQQ